MTISEKTRKILWGRSANRCAICRCELTLAASTPNDVLSVVGDECHIVAREPRGARGDSQLSADDRDDYDNLVLLCKVHHKLVDDQPCKFTVEHLRTLRTAHELWVRDNLSKKPRAPYDPADTFVITRIRTGEEALGLITVSEGHLFTNDGPDTEQEATLLGQFLEDLADYCDLWSELPNSGRLSAQLSTRRQYEQLLSLGFVAYGGSRREKLRFGSTASEHTVCYISLFRRTNPLVRSKPPELEQLFVDSGATDDLSNFVLCGRKP